MKFYIACIQKLNELVSNAATDVNDFFVPCPSLRVFDSGDFEFLSATAGSGDSYLKSEDISIQLNSLSRDNTLWDIDPNQNLYDRYKNALEQLKLKDRTSIETAVKDDFSLLYDAAGKPGKELKTYTARLAKYDELILAYKDLASKPTDTLDDNDKFALSLNMEVAEKKIALHVADWKATGFKDKIEAALEKINKVSEFDRFKNSLDTTKSDMLNAEKTGLQSLAAYSQVNIIPFNFYTEDYSWNSMEMEMADMELYFQKAKSALKGFNNDLLNFDYKEDFISKIKLSFCVIHLRRPWMKKDLLGSDFISETGARNDFIYPKKILLVKDLRVILKDPLTDDDKIKIKGNNFIKFGPIFMKNQFFTNAVSKEAFIKPVTNKMIYSGKMIKSIDTKLASSSTLYTPTAPAVAAVAQPITAAPVSGGKVTMMKPGLFNIHGGFKPAVTPQMSTHATVATITTTADVVPVKMVKSKDFIFFPNTTITVSVQSNLHFSIKDKLTPGVGIYKAEISITDKNSNYFKEIETDNDGTADMSIGKGTYDITIRKNGYREITFTQSVADNSNLAVEKSLEPQVITYDSFFMVGAICEPISI